MPKHNHSVSNIKLAFFLNVAFTIVEIIGGYLTNSVAIMADALHDLGDSLSLGFSWFLEGYSYKKKTKSFSYGYRRFSLLAAMINSIILIVGGFFVLKQALPRLLAPEISNAPGMMILAILGITVNGIAVIRLKKGHSINEKIVSWHLLEDVLGWVAILIISIVNLIHPFPLLDPLLAIIFTIVIGFSILKNFKNVMMIFLQGTPSEVSVTAIEKKLCALNDVENVHDTHVWTMDGEMHVLTTHVVLKKNSSLKKLQDVKCKAKDALKTFNITHSTIEFETDGESCDLEMCE